MEIRNKTIDDGKAVYREEFYIKHYVAMLELKRKER